MLSFIDDDDISGFGRAGFIVVVSSPHHTSVQGALFQINVRGQPIEFSYGQVILPDPFLWKADDLHRAGVQRLIVAMCQAASQEPTLLMFQRQDLPDGLFRSEIQTTTSVCVLAPTAGSADGGDSDGVEWIVPSTAAAQRLLTELTNRQLLHEPFERARTGLMTLANSATPNAS